MNSALMEKIHAELGNKAVDVRPSPSSIQPPSTWQMIKNVSGAVVRVADAVVHNKKVFTSKEELQRRSAICEGCELFTGARCTGCGCASALKNRLETESGQCPLKKW
jgi:hypothetical protein